MLEYARCGVRLAGFSSLTICAHGELVDSLYIAPIRSVIFELSNKSDILCRSSASASLASSPPSVYSSLLPKLTGVFTPEADRFDARPPLATKRKLATGSEKFV